MAVAHSADLQRLLALTVHMTSKHEKNAMMGESFHLAAVGYACHGRVRAGPTVFIYGKL